MMMKYELTGKKKKETVCSARDYFIVANFRTNFSPYLAGYLKIFAAFKFVIYLFIYLFHNFSRNP